jgi:hypothetical protein
MSEYSEYEVQIGQRAYEAYSGQVAGVDPVSGRPLRQWDAVPTTVKQAFIAAGVAAASHPNPDDEDPSRRPGDEDENPATDEQNAAGDSGLAGQVGEHRSGQQPEAYDPGADTVTAVQRRMNEAAGRGDRAEVERIREAERGGKGRSGIVGFEV